MPNNTEITEQIELIEEIETRSPHNLPESARDEATYFGENERRIQFWIVFGLAIIINLALFGGFFYWLFCVDGDKNWHIGLMIILPATTVLLTLLQILKRQQQSENMAINPATQVINTLQSIIENTLKNK